MLMSTPRVHSSHLHSSHLYSLGGAQRATLYLILCVGASLSLSACDAPSPEVTISHEEPSGAEAGAQATEAGAQVTEAGAQATEAGAQATEAGAQATEAGAQATEAGAQAGAQDTNNEPITEALTPEREQEVNLTPPPPPVELPHRARRRLNLDQLDRALEQAVGLPWVERRGGVDVHQLTTLASTLGKPDYLQQTVEDLTPSALFLKFLDDAARELCFKRAELDLSDDAQGEAQGELTDEWGPLWGELTPQEGAALTDEALNA